MLFSELLFSVTTTRRVASLTVTLSKDPLDTNHVGYQQPVPDSEVKPERPCNNHIQQNKCSLNNIRLRLN